jgi:hypothetical protein
VSDLTVGSAVTTPPVRAEESSSLLTPAEPGTDLHTDLPHSEHEQMLLARQSRHTEMEIDARNNPQSLIPPPTRRRQRPLSDKKMYKRALAIVALRAQGFSADEVAGSLGVTKDRVRANLYYANKKGWLTIDSFTDPNDKLEIVLAGKAVRNINALLDGDEDFKGDKETTLEVAKGLGLLKQHQVAKPAETTTNVGLKVEVIMPSTIPETTTQPREGSIGGAPIVDAEVVK